MMMIIITGAMIRTMKKKTTMNSSIPFTITMVAMVAMAAIGRTAPVPAIPLRG